MESVNAALTPEKYNAPPYLAVLDEKVEPIS